MAAGCGTRNRCGSKTSRASSDATGLRIAGLGWAAASAPTSLSQSFRHTQFASRPPSPRVWDTPLSLLARGKRTTAASWVPWSLTLPCSSHWGRGFTPALSHACPTREVTPARPCRRDAAGKSRFNQYCREARASPAWRVSAGVGPGARYVGWTSAGHARKGRARLRARAQLSSRLPLLYPKGARPGGFKGSVRFSPRGCADVEEPTEPGESHLPRNQVVTPGG